MTATLLRHEFLRTRTPLGVALGAALAITAVGALMTRSGADLLATLGSLLCSAAGIGLLLGTVAILAVDYWRSGYGREGYFTQTLPVAGRRIFGARLTYGMIVTALATAVSVALMVTPYAVEGGLDGMIDNVRQAGWLEPLPLTLVALAVVASSWAYLVQLYFSASVGSEARFASFGIGGPVFVWFLVYMVTQALLAAALFALPWGLRLSGGTLSVERYTIAFHSGKQDIGFPIGIVVVMAILLVAMVARTAHSWQHKVSLR